MPSHNDMKSVKLKLAWMYMYMYMCMCMFLLGLRMLFHVSVMGHAGQLLCHVTVTSPRHDVRLSASIFGTLLDLRCCKDTSDISYPTRLKKAISISNRIDSATQLTSDKTGLGPSTQGIADQRPAAMDPGKMQYTEEGVPYRPHPAVPDFAQPQTNVVDTIRQALNKNKVSKLYIALPDGGESSFYS
jgi:hypothetical protein